jgi:hypothetical protein
VNLIGMGLLHRLICHRCKGPSPIVICNFQKERSLRSISNIECRIRRDDQRSVSTVANLTDFRGCPLQQQAHLWCSPRKENCRLFDAPEERLEFLRSPCGGAPFIENRNFLSSRLWVNIPPFKRKFPGRILTNSVSGTLGIAGTMTSAARASFSL